MTIGEVRATYRSVRDRAIALAPAEATYAQELWRSWDDALAAFGDETVIDRPYLDFLTRSATDPELDGIEVLEWLDVYPDAVVDRMPGGLFAQEIPA